jgi:MAPEG family
MASMLIKSSLMAVTAAVLESKYASSATSEGSVLGGVLGVTPMLIVGTGFWAVVHGFSVGTARKKYMDLAKKDGEKEVDERYDLPNLYAQGTSKHARAFNCVQRSHQHIFETFTQTIASAMIGWHIYPISSAIFMLMYSIGRITLSQGYAATEGEASKRYSSKFAIFTWYGVMGLHALAMVAAAKMMLGGKMF